MIKFGFWKTIINMHSAYLEKKTPANDFARENSDWTVWHGNSQVPYNSFPSWLCILVANLELRFFTLQTSFCFQQSFDHVTFLKMPVYYIQSSRNCRPEECTPPGDVATVHTVVPIYATHVPVNFTRVMPFSLQKSHYTWPLFTRWRE